MSSQSSQKRPSSANMGLPRLSPEITLQIAGFLSTLDTQSLAFAIPSLIPLLKPAYPWRNRWRSFKKASSNIYWEVQDAQRQLYDKHGDCVYDNGFRRSQVAYDRSKELEDMICARMKEMGFSDAQRILPDSIFAALHHIFNDGAGEDSVMRIRSIMGDSENISNVASDALETAMRDFAPLSLVDSLIPAVSPPWNGFSRDYALLTSYLYHTSLTPDDVRCLHLSHVGRPVFLDEPSLIEYFCFLGLFLRMYLLDSVLRPPTEKNTEWTGALSHQAVIILESRLDQYLETFFAPSLYRPVLKSKRSDWRMVSSQGTRGQLTFSSSIRNNPSSSQESSSQGTKKPGDEITLTAEQGLIVEADIKKGELFKVRAFAGTGKTRSLVEFAAARPRLKMIYIAFNKAAAVDADTRFRHCRNVTTKTLHSIAYGTLRLTNRRAFKRLDADRSGYIERMTPEKMAEQLGLGKTTDVRLCYTKPPGERWKEIFTNDVGRMVMMTLERFCESNDEKVTEYHLPSHLIITKDMKPPIILELARRAWEQIASGKSDSITHDMYLKFMALNDKGDDAAFQYDVVLFDEAQDASSSMAQIVLRQRRKCGIIIVGDPYQMIYSFRGAKNECFNDQLFPPTRSFHLTTSFRFGPEIASMANALLRNLREPVQVQGVRKKTDETEGIYRLTKKGLFPNDRLGGYDLQYAMVFRKNCTMIRYCLQHAMKDIKFFFKTAQNNHSSRVFPLLRDAYMLYRHNRPSRLKGLAGFKTWNDAKSYFGLHSEDETDERVLALAIVLPLESMIANEEISFLGILDKCQQNISRSEKEADIILSTVHQSKGLEYDNVALADDFNISPDDPEAATFGFHRRKEVMNLLYVACTRAKKRLFLSNTALQFLVQERGLYRLFVSPTQNRDKCPVCKGIVSSSEIYQGISDSVARILIGYESLAPRAFEESEDLTFSAPKLSPTFPAGKKLDVVCCVGCAIRWQSLDRETDHDLIRFMKGLRLALAGAKPTQPTGRTVFLHNKVLYPETLRCAIADCLADIADRKCLFASNWARSETWSIVAYQAALKEEEERRYDDDEIDDWIGSAEY